MPLGVLGDSVNQERLKQPSPGPESSESQLTVKQLEGSPALVHLYSLNQTQDTIVPSRIRKVFY
jgi:hypothetical protein